MSLSSFPNEILVSIFSNLSFEDVLQCSLLCKRFADVSKLLHLEEWKLNSTLRSNGGQPNRFVTTSDAMLIVYSNGSADFFEFGQISTSLFKTVTCPENTLPDFPPSRAAAIIPSSRTIVYQPSPDPSSRVGAQPSPDTNSKTFVVFDLEKSINLCKVVVPAAIFSISCSREAVAVLTGEDETDTELFLYAWDARSRTTQLLRSFSSTWSFDISPNGLLAFVSLENETQICIYDAHRNIDLGLLQFTEIIWSTMISSDGKKLAALGPCQLNLVDLTNKTVIFEYSQNKMPDPLARVYIPRWTNLCPLFEDVVYLIGSNVITALYLKRDQTGNVSIDFEARLAEDSEYKHHFPYRSFFHRINGKVVCQYVDDNGVLKICGLNK